MPRPRVNREGDKELEKIEQQLSLQEDKIKELTLDEMNKTPVKQMEQQTKLSQKDIEKSKDIYLKPKRAIASREKFNEKFREDYEYDKQYVHFVAENKEIIGETIDLWTKPYAGMPAEEWDVPVNKPIWGPRYLAEQIKRKTYHRLVMQNTPTEAGSGMQYYGSMTVDTTIQRLDANPVSKKRSVFMSAEGF
jgi:hypothetical protein